MSRPSADMEVVFSGATGLADFQEYTMEPFEFEIKDDDGVVFTIDQSYEASDCDTSDGDVEVPTRKISVSPPKAIGDGPHAENLRRQGRLLLVSLLENFCSLYDKNPGKNHKLFLILCKKLSTMGVLESADFVDEAANVRTVYKRAFRDLVFEAIKGLEGTESHRFLLKSSRDDVGKEEHEEGEIEGEDFEDEDLGRREELTEKYEEFTTFDELLFPEHSRYLEDFVEVGCLGKGGFGTVFQARNKLDGRYYAIKKIRFSSVYSPRYQRIVREVKSLACMDHSNIVRYNAAWVEESQEEVFVRPSGDEHTETSDFRTSIDSLADDLEQVVKIKSPHLVMYIQMELCQYTLSDWISRRNGLLFAGARWELDEFPVDYFRMVCSNLDGALDINVQENKRIFKSIVKGLQYIHSHGLIHRDLKPQNIFFHGTEHVPKIGDFGLVSTNQLFSESSSDSSVEILWEAGNSSDLTSGIGTSVYASPEQLNGSVYDEKSDIYSLGIVLFELFYPIKTQMERSRVLSDLKQSKHFPTDFLKRYPKEAALIWCCLSSDPSTRPSADEILDSELLDQDLEEHFLRISEDNEDLRELLRMQFEDNNRLKIENEIQALEIEALKEKIRLLEELASS